MFDLMSFQGGRWVYHGTFTDLERAIDAAEEHYGLHDRVAVFSAGVLIHEPGAQEAS